MITVRPYLLAFLPLLSPLGGCAGGDARYPSLAMRPFETTPLAPALESTAAPTRPLVGPQALSELVARASAADARFARQRREAERRARAAAGQPVESNVRAAALVAMADLTATRGETSAVLADLDQLAAESATSLAPDAEIGAARGEVEALVAGQDAAIARLWQGMGQ